MKTADAFRKPHYEPNREPRHEPSLLTALVRKAFVFVLARAPRSRLAAFTAAAMALVFARQLLAHNAPRPQASGRVIEGEYRRIRDPR